MKPRFLAALLLPALAHSGSAAILTWNSPSAGGTWDTTTSNWLNGASPATWTNSPTNSAVFSSTGVGTVTLGTGITVTGITFSTAGYTIASNTLTLSGTPVFTATADATISSDMAGTAGMTKEGTGILTLSGNKSYTGTTTINAGTLSLTGGGGGTGVIRGTATVTANGTLRLGVSNATGYDTNRVTTLNITGGLVDNVASGDNIWGTTINMTGGTLRSNGGTSSTTTGQLFSFGGPSAGTMVINSLASANTSTIAGRINLRENLTNNLLPLNVANGAAATDLLVSAGITAGSASYGISKTGAGVLAITGEATFTGPTNVTAGTLSLGAANAYPSTPITLSAGAVFDVSARTNFTIASGKTLSAGRATSPATDVNGTIALSSGGILNPGGSGTKGTLTLNGGLQLNGGTVNVEGNSSGPDLIAMNGALALTGTTTFYSATYIPPGTYPVVSGFTSSSGSASNLAWTSSVRGLTGSFTVDPTSVSVTISGTASPSSLTWSGTNSGVWDVNGALNWNGGTERFFNLDSVTFPSTPTNATLSVIGEVTPASMDFTSTSTAYIVRGSGLISGTGTLTKTGAAQLTIWHPSSTFSGGTTISGGIVFLNLGAAVATGTYTPLGTGPITINPGAILQFDPSNGGGNTYTYPNAINLAGGILYQIDGINRFSGVTTVSAASTARTLYGGKDLYLDGGLAGSGALTITDVNSPYGSGAVHIGADGTYNGAITINKSGGQNGSMYVHANSAMSGATVAIETDSSSDGSGLTLASPATNVTIAGLTSTNTASRVHNADATTRTLTVNNAVTNTFLGSIGDGTANGNRLNLVKSGAGTLNLGAANTYTGTTTVSGGTLVVPSSQSSSGFGVDDGTSLTVKAAAGVPLATTSFRLGQATGATLSIQSFPGSTTVAPITTTTLETHGTVALNISGNLAVGTYPVIQYTTLTGSGAGAFSLGSLPRGVVASLVDSGTSINLVVSSIDALVWTGAAGTAWDINTTANWSITGNPSTYLDGDSVLFDATAGANTAVTLGTTVTPYGVTVNSASDYSITGPGVIAGSGALTKSGAGTLTLSTANTFSGSVSIQGGVVKLGNAAALGSGASGTSVTSGAALDLNGISLATEALSIAGTGIGSTGALVNTGAAATLGGNVTLAAAASIGGTGEITLTNDLSGSAGLTKSGSGTLTLTASSSSLTGTLTVAGGTVSLAGYPSLANAPFVVENGGTLSVAQTNALASRPTSTLVKSGGTFTVANGVTTNIGGNGATITLEGGATLGGSTPDGYYGSWTINTPGRVITVAGGSATAATVSGAGITSPQNGDLLTFSVADVTGSPAVDLNITGNFGTAYRNSFPVTFQGAGTVSLNSANTTTGAFTVAAGTTLTGPGTIPGPLVVAGTIAPGTGIGTFTAGSASITGTYACQIDGATRDLLAVNGALDISGATLTVSAGGALAGTYTIATFTGGLTGTFATTSLPAGYEIDYTVPGQINLVPVASGFAGWINAFDIENEADRVATADPDHDGVPNAVEYVLGGDPTESSQAGLPVATKDENGAWVFEFDRTDDSETEDIDLVIQVGATLETWDLDYTVGADTASSTEGVVIEENGDEPDHITLTVPAGLLGTKVFGRLKVIVADP